MRPGRQRRKIQATATMIEPASTMPMTGASTMKSAVLVTAWVPTT